jgi:hypothetical protein
MSFNLNSELRGQSALVRTQAHIVADELTRRLGQNCFAGPGDDVSMVIKGLERFLENLRDLRWMMEVGQHGQ